MCVTLNNCQESVVLIVVAAAAVVVMMVVVVAAVVIISFVGTVTILYFPDGLTTELVTVYRLYLSDIT